MALSSVVERDLITHLLANYSAEVRPVDKHSKPITVYIGVALNQLIDVVSTPNGAFNP